MGENQKPTNVGRLSAVIGAVLDVDFTGAQLPDIHNALVVENDQGQQVWMEVAQHLGGNQARCIALQATEGPEPRPDGDRYRFVHHGARGQGHPGPRDERAGPEHRQQGPDPGDLVLPIHRSAPPSPSRARRWKS